LADKKMFMGEGEWCGEGSSMVIVAGFLLARVGVKQVAVVRASLVADGRPSAIDHGQLSSWFSLSFRLSVSSSPPTLPPTPSLLPHASTLSSSPATSAASPDSQRRRHPGRLPQSRRNAREPIPESDGAPDVCWYGRQGRGEFERRCWVRTSFFVSFQIYC
jgi:hypothetical protein